MLRILAQKGSKDIIDEASWTSDMSSLALALQEKTFYEFLQNLLWTIKADRQLRFAFSVLDLSTLTDPVMQRALGRKIASLFLVSGSMFDILPYLPPGRSTLLLLVQKS
jgi:hypothetical protein